MDTQVTHPTITSLDTVPFTLKFLPTVKYIADVVAIAVLGLRD
ncbi:hypothetical protein [Nostoc sp.]